MSYEKYKSARNASWEIIIDFGISELPVSIAFIYKKLGISIHKYCDSKSIIDKYRLSDLVIESDGFTINTNDSYHVFYNENVTDERAKFTLAHELGHIICDQAFIQSGELYITARNNEPSENDESEMVANVFASRLLAPACVLHELKLFSAKEISKVCGISMQSAEFRLKRLLLLEQRNKDFLETRGHGCFYISDREKQVYKQFENFINSNRQLREQ